MAGKDTGRRLFDAIRDATGRGSVMGRGIPMMYRALGSPLTYPILRAPQRG